MFLNNREHLLSNALCGSAVINLAMQIVNAVLRIIFHDNASQQDMLNDGVWMGNIASQCYMVLVICILFYQAYRRLKKYEDIIPDEDEKMEIAKLQKQFIPEGISSLSLDSIKKLLGIWATILIWSKILYIVTIEQYRYFVSKLTELVDTSTAEGAMNYSAIYDTTHYFKYVGMFTTIILGVIITGIFLKDKLLFAVSVGISLVFVICAAAFNMVVFTTSFKVISIVWTSVIFHGVETAGIFLLSFYLSRHYRGL